jgi:DNA mismatch repair protein MutL
VLSELLERATSLEGEPAEVATRLEEEVVAMIAGKAASKVNHPLTPVEQQALLRDLVQTEQPWRCSHGRPILLRLSQEEMERRLGRR